MKFNLSCCFFLLHISSVKACKFQDKICDRQTDEQAGRQTDEQAGRQTDRQTQMTCNPHACMLRVNSKLNLNQDLVVYSIVK